MCEYCEGGKPIHECDNVGRAEGGGVMDKMLKSCPFCGGEPDVHYFAHDYSECTVMCSNPNCRASVSARSCGSMTTAYNRARKLWNRRAERTCRMVPVVNGRVWKCSWCGQVSLVEARGGYCPRCGARIVKEEA